MKKSKFIAEQIVYALRRRRHASGGYAMRFPRSTSFVTLHDERVCVNESLTGR